MRATGRTMSHNKTCVAANTPCSDGDRVFALFSSNDLFAFDLDGNLLWLRGLTFDYPNASNSLGMAQSPVVIDGTLVVQSENDSESFAAGLDVVGAVAIEALSHIHADSFFMGVTGVHPQAGLTTGDLEEAYMKRACSERAAETFVLASTEKLGVASAYVIAPVTRASGLIIEQAVEEKVVEPYVALGVTILRA